MDLNKLTNFEKENRDNILRIEELMETADDRKTIENFFQKQ